MRYSSEKRPYLFIETAKQIEKLPNTHFVLIGDGPLMDQVSRLVRRYGLNERIILLGGPPNLFLVAGV